MSTEELTDLARELYEAWREKMIGTWPATLWPWDALFVPEKDVWFAIAVAAEEAMDKMGQLSA